MNKEYLIAPSLKRTQYVIILRDIEKWSRKSNLKIMLHILMLIFIQYENMKFRRVGWSDSPRQSYRTFKLPHHIGWPQAIMTASHLDPQ